MNRKLLSRFFEAGNLKRAAREGAAAAVEGGMLYFAQPALEKALEPWTPEAVRKAIQANLDLFGSVDLSPYRAQAQAYLPLLRHISTQTIAQWVGALRPDLSQVVNEEPGGETWLTAQLEILRSKAFNL